MRSYLHNWNDQFGRGVTRREFLRWAAITLAAPRLRAEPDLWTAADEIVRRVAEPAFSDRSFDIMRYGAKPDGATDCAEAFRAAIAACRQAGGGRVIVPCGRFLTGAIRLRSKVNLHLDDEATIAFSRDPKAYLPVVLTRYEGVEVMREGAERQPRGWGPAAIKKVGPRAKCGLSRQSFESRSGA